MVRKDDNLTDLYCIFNCDVLGDPKPIIKDQNEVNEAAWMSLPDLKINFDTPDYTRYIISHALAKGNGLKIDHQWNAERLKLGRFLKYEHFI